MTISEEIHELKMQLVHQANNHGGHLMLNKKDTNDLFLTLEYFSSMVEQMEAEEQLTNKKKTQEKSNVVSFKQFKKHHHIKQKGDAV